MKNVNYRAYGSGMIDFEAKERARMLDKVIKVLSFGVVFMAIILLGAIIFS